MRLWRWSRHCPASWSRSDHTQPDAAALKDTYCGVILTPCPCVWPASGPSLHLQDATLENPISISILYTMYICGRMVTVPYVTSNGTTIRFFETPLLRPATFNLFRRLASMRVLDLGPSHLLPWSYRSSGSAPLL